MRPRLAAGMERVARLAVGPLAFAALFLPWGRGSGPLAELDFTGFELIALSGDLQVMASSTFESLVLWGARIGLLMAAALAAWQTLLAPTLRWHPAYRLSGWLLVTLATVALGAALVRGGGAPLPGLALFALAAAAFAACESRSVAPARLSAWSGRAAPLPPNPRPRNG